MGAVTSHTAVPVVGLMGDQVLRTLIGVFSMPQGSRSNPTPRALHLTPVQRRTSRSRHG